MKRFTSRMEALRRVRRQTEQLAKTTAAQHRSQKAAADERVSQVRSQLQQLQHEHAQLLAGGLSGSQLNVLLAQAGRTGQLLTTVRQQQLEADRRLQQSVTAFHSARAELQVVEQLIERQRQEHRRQQLVAQEHAAGELAAQTHHQRQADAAARPHSSQETGS